MKIKPELKHLEITGAPNEKLNKSGDCWVMVHATIGPPDLKGGELFLFYVTTPRHLLKVIKEGNYRFGKSLLIVDKYDQNLVQMAIEKLLEHINGNNWKDIAFQISRYSQWEFENYQEKK